MPSPLPLLATLAGMGLPQISVAEFSSTTFTPSPSAVFGSIWISALVGIIPLVLYFALVGLVRLSAHWAGLFSLTAAVLFAVTAFHMPWLSAFSAAAQGATFGVISILWVVIMAIWLYEISVSSGRIDDLKDLFSAMGGGDRRVQGLLVALCFGALLEGLAGFGVPVAIVGTLLISFGFKPVRAIVVALVANMTPVAYAAIGVPITTAAALMNGTDKAVNAKLVAVDISTQVPFLALVMPFILLYLLDGKRAVRQLFALGTLMAVADGLGQFLVVRFIAFELGAVIPPFVTFILACIFVRYYRWTTPNDCVTAPVTELKAIGVFWAVFPYLLVILALAGAKLCPAAMRSLTQLDPQVHWPFLTGAVNLVSGPTASHLVGAVSLPIFSSPGLVLGSCAVIVAGLFTWQNEGGLRALGVRSAWWALVRVLKRMRFSALIIAIVMAMAAVMNYSGQTLAIGTCLAASGSAFVVLSPVLGWIGTAVTGSTTSANALFSALQESTAHQVGLPGAFAVAANTTGGVIGKLISPQNLAIAAGTINQPGSEVRLLRLVLGWSLGLLGVAVIIIAGNWAVSCLF